MPRVPSSTASALAPVVVRDLSVSFPDREVLRDVDLVAQPGRRLGLVGENGAGKSTLLRAVAGRLPARAAVRGTVESPSGLVLLGQEPPFPDAATVDEVLASALRPLHEAVAAVETLAARLDDERTADRYALALEHATAHDAWDADRRARLAAERLGLGSVAGHRRVGSLSGGERTRLALAAVMTTRPTALLLDEPTNHLDDDATSVLTAFLRDLPGPVLLASHDRVLLDDVCTDLVDLDPTASTAGAPGEGGTSVRRFGGGWSAYVEHRLAERRRWEETWIAQTEEVARLRAAAQVGTGAVAHGRGPRDNDKFVHAFKGARVEQTVARRRRDAERRLAVALREQVPKPPRPLTFAGLAPSGGGGGGVVRVRALAVQGRLRLDGLDVEAGEHLLVTGSNGAGKSTLLGVLAGRLTPTSGEVAVRARRVAELPQDVVLPDPRLSVQATYARGTRHLPPASVPPLADLGLLHPRDHARPAGALSVGQRRRLGLALVVAAAPDLLLLDEPTNHLSLALAGELEEALESSGGTVLVASHDRWLRRRWTGREVRLQSWATPDDRPGRRVPED
ncbi:ABC-F family ATP-binding cassette domain-containing protein [Nocardioides solisilvae]|uniref:ABC-F family ATP-binding cassette domain-containing protein n=1 Tax=Nocardioides solisilvae TaxID=1542435 RepID=UPI000D749D17|nr:ABC-F family ATP-binding cassette domain-containing protein [Nocardioides solisilvae]